MRHASVCPPTGAKVISYDRTAQRALDNHEAAMADHWAKQARLEERNEMEQHNKFEEQNK
jgi:hypothetical protein